MKGSSAPRGESFVRSWLGKQKLSGEVVCSYAVHAVLLKELNGFDEQVRKLAKGNARTRLLMTAPGVGPMWGLPVCLMDAFLPRFVLTAKEARAGIVTGRMHMSSRRRRTAQSPAIWVKASLPGEAAP